MKKWKTSICIAMYNYSSGWWIHFCLLFGAGVGRNTVKNKHLHWYENYSGWWIYLCLFLSGVGKKPRMILQAWRIKEQVSALVWNYCGWWWLMFVLDRSWKKIQNYFPIMKEWKTSICKFALVWKLFWLVDMFPFAIGGRCWRKCL